MASFQLRIPPPVKVTLPIDVDNPNTTPAQAFTTLTNHFDKPDPFLQENLRSVVEYHQMGKRENFSRFFTWHREHRYKMVAAQFPGIEDEEITAKWILRRI